MRTSDSFLLYLAFDYQFFVLISALTLILLELEHTKEISEILELLARGKASSERRAIHLSNHTNFRQVILVGITRTCYMQAFLTLGG